MINKLRDYKNKSDKRREKEYSITMMFDILIYCKDKAKFIAIVRDSFISVAEILITFSVIRARTEV